MAVFGYKHLRIAGLPNAPAKLYSPYTGYEWLPGANATDAPTIGSVDGFYAYKGFSWAGGSTIPVFVALWGTVIEHGIGYRGEYAEVMELVKPICYSCTRRDAAVVVEHEETAISPGAPYAISGLMRAYRPVCRQCAPGTIIDLGVVPDGEVRLKPMEELMHELSTYYMAPISPTSELTAIERCTEAVVLEMKQRGLKDGLSGRTRKYPGGEGYYEILEDAVHTACFSPVDLVISPHGRFERVISAYEEGYAEGKRMLGVKG